MDDEKQENASILVVVLVLFPRSEDNIQLSSPGILKKIYIVHYFRYS